MAVYYHLIYKNMKKITRSQIIITSLILGLVLALPVAFARAQDANRPDDAGNQAEANRNHRSFRDIVYFLIVRIPNTGPAVFE